MTVTKNVKNSVFHFFATKNLGIPFQAFPIPTFALLRAGESGEVGRVQEFAKARKCGAILLPEKMSTHNVLTHWINRPRKHTKETKTDGVTEGVIADLRVRSAKGLRKYGLGLSENNRDNMIQHAYEEALDLAQYLKKELTTRKTVQELVKRTKDDKELGSEVRRVFG